MNKFDSRCSLEYQTNVSASPPTLSIQPRLNSYLDSGFWDSCHVVLPPIYSIQPLISSEVATWVGGWSNFTKLLPSQWHCHAHWLRSQKPECNSVSIAWDPEVPSILSFNRQLFVGEDVCWGDEAGTRDLHMHACVKTASRHHRDGRSTNFIPCLYIVEASDITCEIFFRQYNRFQNRLRPSPFNKTVSTDYLTQF